MQPIDARLYSHWILANGWAEAVGLGTTLVLAWLLAPAVDQTLSPVTVVLGALGAVALGALLEGVVVGIAQESVLRRRLPYLQRGRWTVATALGAGVAWFLGMIPSTLMALASPQPASAPGTEPGPLVQYGLAAGLGVLLGLILGGAQWFVLRRYTRRSTWWLWANAIAWGVGMPVVFMAMDLISRIGSAAAIISAVILACGGVGILVGAIHGRVLVLLVNSAHSEHATA